MKALDVVPKERLPTVIAGARAPVWWGMMLLVAIEITVFATLFSSYFYLRFRAPEWPPAGVAPPDLLLPIVNTVILFSSSIAVLWASSALKKGNLRHLEIGMGIGIVLEIVFFGIKLVVTAGTEYGWTDHAYGSIFSLINDLHSGHVLVAILMAVAVYVLVLRGYITRERRLGVQLVNIYWQFVAVAWAGVFVVLFLVPRWF